jgi:hypothetical protein
LFRSHPTPVKLEHAKLIGEIWFDQPVDGGTKTAIRDSTDGLTEKAAGELQSPNARAQESLASDHRLHAFLPHLEARLDMSRTSRRPALRNRDSKPA